MQVPAAKSLLTVSGVLREPSAQHRLSSPIGRALGRALHEKQKASRKSSRRKTGRRRKTKIYEKPWQGSYFIEDEIRFPLTSTDTKKLPG
jgi:hypothetical protein